MSTSTYEALSAVERVLTTAAEFRSGCVAVPYRTPVELRATITSADGSGGGVIGQGTMDAVMTAGKGGRIAPLLRVVPVGPGRVFAPTETSRTEAAAPTADGTSLPEAGIAFNDAEVPPKRVGVFIPVHKDTLEDRGQIRNMLDVLTDDEWLRVLDAQVLSGDGTGEHLSGILTNGSITTQPLSTDTRFDAVVKAASTVRSANHVGPIDVVATATDLQELLLEKDSAGAPTFRREVLDALGVRGFVPSSNMTAGQFLVGAYGNATLYVRDGLSVGFSTDHADWFLLGKVAVAAEARCSLKVARPSAFVKVTGV